MTAAEFDTYLASIGGLQSCYKPDLLILNSGFFEFDTGWFAITKSLIDDLIALGWDKQICQAKEKFATGRFYTGPMSDEMHERVRQWMAKTSKTCEACGSTENVQIHGRSWIRTLCDTCAGESKT